MTTQVWSTFPFWSVFCAPWGALWTHGRHSVCALFGFGKALGWKQLNCFIWSIAHCTVSEAAWERVQRQGLPLRSSPTPAREGEMMDAPLLVFHARPGPLAHLHLFQSLTFQSFLYGNPIVWRPAFLPLVHLPAPAMRARPVLAWAAKGNLAGPVGGQVTG